LKTVGTHYYYSRPSFNSTIILSKVPAKFYEVKFSKGMKTKPMSICTFSIECSDKKTRSIVVHSVHLKMRSADTNITRACQLKAISKINKKFDLSIMAGDYNFDDAHDDNNLVKFKYLDLLKHNLDRFVFE